MRGGLFQICSFLGCSACLGVVAAPLADTPVLLIRAQFSSYQVISYTVNSLYYTSRLNPCASCVDLMHTKGVRKIRKWYAFSFTPTAEDTLHRSRRVPAPGPASRCNPSKRLNPDSPPRTGQSTSGSLQDASGNPAPARLSPAHQPHLPSTSEPSVLQSLLHLLITSSHVLGLLQSSLSPSLTKTALTKIIIKNKSKRHFFSVLILAAFSILTTFPLFLKYTDLR